MHCVACIAMRCRIALRDRSGVPARCCRKEYPIEYVAEVLTTREKHTYDRFMQAQCWQTRGLHSDQEYIRVIRNLSFQLCPGCGIGVERTSGCNHMACPRGHEFCYRCGVIWKRCDCPQS
ncbi:TPA: hypothetical protein N0F65_003260 [Lagenidium giganteum]|uniref:IBR domain-containing protein n=1 Tax=Lagenidium giganteum TaxID=4803 RepID=A0AAV2YJV8_9STRA|nr:TPA: hypothetical protein N0F65_003260 [Lagenidium giganteum]